MYLLWSKSKISVDFCSSLLEMIKIKKELFIGIDLGTSFSKIYVKDKGFIKEVPTVIAINRRNREVIAIGEEAKKMLGRNPINIEVIKPINFGVVTNFEEALYFLEELLKDIKKEYFSILGNILVIGIPLDLTEVQKRGVVDVGLGIGAKKVYLVEEPIACALGANLDIEEAKGILVVDIGGGTTDIALISLGGIVIGKSIRIGGDVFNQNIIDYLKNNYEIIIGEGQAEEAKIHVGSILNKNNSFLIKGRDIFSGLPKEVNFNNEDLRESIYDSLVEIVNQLKDIINLTPPDLLADLGSLGIFLAGGGSLIEGIDLFLEKEIKIKVNLIEEPKYSVIRGIGKIIEDFGRYKKLLISEI